MMTIESKARCVIAATGLKSEQGQRLGAVVLAILHHSPRPLPAFIDAAFISDDGLVFTHMIGPDRQRYDVCLGKVEVVRDSVRRFADKLHLPDVDRISLFDEFKKWIVKDGRARSE